VFGRAAVRSWIMSEQWINIVITTRTFTIIDQKRKVFKSTQFNNRSEAVNYIECTIVVYGFGNQYWTFRRRSIRYHKV